MGNRNSRGDDLTPMPEVKIDLSLTDSVSISADTSENKASPPINSRGVPTLRFTPISSGLPDEIGSPRFVTMPSHGGGANGRGTAASQADKEDDDDEDDRCFANTTCGADFF